jgi:nicotinate-nucleotide--dimethylbenzimidazole phosphoribosyltransferase
VVPDLLDISAEIRATDTIAAATARAAAPGSGRLSELAGWLAATAGRWPVALDRVRLRHAGPLAPAARELAADDAVEIRPLPAATDTVTALEAGIAAADEDADAGNRLVLVTAGTVPPAAVVVALLTGSEPVRLLPRGAHAVNSAAWIAEAAALRDARRRALPLRYRAGELTAELGSPQLAATIGYVLRSAARCTPMVLDGPASVAAGLLAFDLRPRAAEWWQLADPGGDPVAALAAEHLGQRGVLDLGGRGGDGVTALLTVAILRAAARLHTVEAADD